MRKVFNLESVVHSSLVKVSLSFKAYQNWVFLRIWDLEKNKK